MSIIAGIAKFLWGLFGSTLIELALTSGLSAVMSFLKEKGLPQFLVNMIVAMLKAVLGEIPTVVATAHTDIAAVKADASLSKAEKGRQIRAIKNNAKREYRRKCSGVACAAETKALD